jgi:chromosome segregation ATPase
MSDERLERLERVVGEIADTAAGGLNTTGDELVRLQARTLRLEAAHLRLEATVDELERALEAERDRGDRLAIRLVELERRRATGKGSDLTKGNR